MVFLYVLFAATPTVVKLSYVYATVEEGGILQLMISIIAFINRRQIYGEEIVLHCVSAGPCLTGL